MSRRQWNAIWWLTRHGEEILRWRPTPPYLFGDAGFIQRLWAKSVALGGGEVVAEPGLYLEFVDKDRYSIYFLCLLTTEGEEGYEFHGAEPDLADLWLDKEDDQIPSLLSERVY